MFRAGLAITVIRNPIDSTRVSVKGNHSRHRPAIPVEFLLKEITVATNSAIAVDFLLKEITVAMNPAIAVDFLLKEITVATNPEISVDFLLKETTVAMNPAISNMFIQNCFPTAFISTTCIPFIRNVFAISAIAHAIVLFNKKNFVFKLLHNVCSNLNSALMPSSVNCVIRPVSHCLTHKYQCFNPMPLSQLTIPVHCQELPCPREFFNRIGICLAMSL